MLRMSSNLALLSILFPINYVADTQDLKYELDWKYRICTTPYRLALIYRADQISDSYPNPRERAGWTQRISQKGFDPSRGPASFYPTPSALKLFGRVSRWNESFLNISGTNGHLYLAAR